MRAEAFVACSTGWPGTEAFVACSGRVPCSVGSSVCSAVPFWIRDSGFFGVGRSLGSWFFVESGFWVGRQAEVTSTCYQRGRFSIQSCVG
jgi:hypothetical protein